MHTNLNDTWKVRVGARRVDGHWPHLRPALLRCPAPPLGQRDRCQPSDQRRSHCGPSLRAARRVWSGPACAATRPRRSAVCTRCG
eukprot:623710-Prorocentrum_minimum.AAC.1